MSLTFKLKQDWIKSKVILKWYTKKLLKLDIQE